MGKGRGMFTEEEMERKNEYTMVNSKEEECKEKERVFFVRRHEPVE